MDFTQIFLDNWQGIFVCLGPGLAIGKIVELVLANIKNAKKWAEIAEKVAGVITSSLMGFVLLNGLKMPLESVLIVVSFSLLVHTGFISIVSLLKKGAKKKAGDQ